MNISIKVIARSALILALAIAIQSVRLPQFITGPVVNALLFFATAVIGTTSGVLIGLMTPAIAFAFGIMPLAPVVPVIMLGNAVLAAVFGIFKDRPYTGFILASVAKFGVMWLFISYLLPSLLKMTLPPQVTAMLTTPQLFTALGGGVLAIIILKTLHWLKKENKVSN